MIGLDSSSVDFSNDILVDSTEAGFETSSGCCGVLFQARAKPNLPLLLTLRSSARRDVHNLSVASMAGFQVICGATVTSSKDRYTFASESFASLARMPATGRSHRELECPRRQGKRFRSTTEDASLLNTRSAHLVFSSACYTFGAAFSYPCVLRMNHILTQQV